MSQLLRRVPGVGESLTERLAALQEVCQRVASRQWSEAPDVTELLDVLDSVWWILRTATEVKDTAAVEARGCGATWQQIAESLRVERQVVWRKYNLL